MGKIKFLPSEKAADINVEQKLLVVARKNQIPIRFGCAACRCGTCAVKVSAPSGFSPMKPDETALLGRMRLPVSGEIRLACQAKYLGTIDADVDISFQDSYSPDDGDGDGSL